MDEVPLEKVDDAIGRLDVEPVFPASRERNDAAEDADLAQLELQLRPYRLAGPVCCFVKPAQILGAGGFVRTRKTPDAHRRRCRGAPACRSR
jgi:hypothetical protein